MLLQSFSEDYICVCVCVFRFQPVGLVERIQAIAQNVSNMAVRVEQILQKSKNTGRGAYTNWLTTLKPYRLTIEIKCVCIQLQIHVTWMSLLGWGQSVKPKSDSVSVVRNWLMKKS